MTFCELGNSSDYANVLLCRHHHRVNPKYALVFHRKTIATKGACNANANMSETTNAEGAPAKQQPAATAPNRGVNHKTRSKAWKLNNQTANGQVSSPQQQQQSTPQQHQQQAAAKQNPPATRYNDNAKNTRKPKTAHNRRNQPAQPAVTDQLVVDVLNFLQHCDWRQPPAQMFRQLMELMQRPDAQTFSMLEAVRHDLQHVLHARFASNEVWRIHPFGSAISTLSFRGKSSLLPLLLSTQLITPSLCLSHTRYPTNR